MQGLEDVALQVGKWGPSCNSFSQVLQALLLIPVVEVELRYPEPH
jgi:hypothetical protein